MANPKIEFRFPPIMHAYLEDLGKLGPYGRGKNGVARRFVEEGIKKALEENVVEAKSTDDFGDDETDNE